MSTPTVAELRRVCQPAGLTERLNGEHWAGRWYMRRVSIHATRLFLRLGTSPNQLTAAMIFAGVAAGPILLFPGLTGAVLCVLLVQLYLLLDCSDGEVARWTRRTSIQGVYLDRVGHYLAEASLMIGVGLRAADGALTGYAVLGCLAALGVVLVKAETDLVDVARARSGMAAATDDSVELRSKRAGQWRRVASALRIHRVTGAVEASLLVLVAGVVDAVRGDVLATQFLVVVLVVVAAAAVVLHLTSILLSRRLA